MNTKLAIWDWHWEITKRCNLSCLHCILGDHSDYEMTTKEAFNAISSIVKLGGKRLFITGGEPLMRDDLCLIIREAHYLGLVVYLITNGTMINKLFLENVGRYIRSIAVSIEGHQQVQDKIRGRGIYNKCVSAIELISDFNIDVSVYTTIHALNENSIGVFIEKMIPLGVNNFHFNEINPEGRAQKNKKLLLSPKKTTDRADSILLQLQKVIEIERFGINSDCLISPDTVYLQSNGTLFACVELAFKSPFQRMANILKQNTREMEEWVGYFFSKIKRPECGKCCYTSFFSPGINICLNEQKRCPLIRRIDYESTFA